MPQRANLAIDTLTLAKPGITAMVLAATAWGYLVGRPPQADLTHLALVLVGAMLVGAGGNTLNQYVERDTDALMNRTRNRPLPMGRIGPKSAFVAGVALGVTGIVELGIVANISSAAIGMLIFASYVLLYTPLKRITFFSIFVGALPGAAPPVLGWIAAGREWNDQALALFMILYVWQIPHVLAITWRYKDEYKAAGLRMLPGNDPGGWRTRVLIVLFSLVLMPVSAYPAAIGLAGMLYFYGSLVISGLFLLTALSMCIVLSAKTARMVFGASLLYLPLIIALMIYDSLPRSFGSP